MSDQEQQSNQSGGGEDFVDKGLDAVEKKELGQDLPRAENEKITDGARDAVESVTGDDVPDKVSN